MAEEENEGEFDWVSYLTATNSIAAPASCFFQSSEPPVNNFEEGTSVEAFDSRFPTINCVGIITGKFGPKVRIRMVGAGANDDFWAMVDSKQIRPVGTAENQGTMLQPPFNSQQDSFRWARLLRTTLQNTKAAPTECFQPEPSRPTSNTFKVGWKIEASDTKDPTFVCPATIRELRGDRIRVEFDGWNICDWFRYDSREIYPAGWWAKTGAKIQPPPSKKKKRVVSNTSSQQKPQSIVDNNGESSSHAENSMTNFFETAGNILTTDIPKDTRSNETGDSHVLNGSREAAAPKICKPLSNGRAAVRHKARKTVGAVGGSSTSAPSSSSVSSSDAPPPFFIKASPLNGGPLTISAKFGGDEAAKSTHLNHWNSSGDDNVVSSSAAVAVKSSPTPPAAYRSPDSSESSKRKSWVIIPSPNGPAECKPDLETSEANEFVVYLNPSCAHGRWLDSSKLRQANTRFGPGSVNHVMRSCMQMLVDCSSDVNHVLSSLPPGDGHASVSADVDGSTRICRLPYFRSILDAWKYLAAVLDKLQTCPHLISKKYDSCMSCDSVASSFRKKRKMSSTIDALSLDITGNRRRHVSGESSSSTCTDKDAGLLICNEDISKWTVDQVVRFVYSVADSASADLFRKQEIDGKALLLLTPDMMIRYMNVRLGPALKIGSAIERLKSTCNRRIVPDH